MHSKTAKVARNAEIVKKLEKGASFGDIAKEYKFKSRGTVWGIWNRAQKKKLSTRK